MRIDISLKLSPSFITLSVIHHPFSVNSTDRINSKNEESTEKYESVIRHLTTGDKVTPHFKAWVKKKRFSIHNIPALDIVDTLVVPADEKDPLRLGNFKRVIPADKMFDVVRQVHCTELQHAGYKKTFEKVQRMFNGIPRSYVQELSTLPVIRTTDRPTTHSSHHRKRLP